MKHRKRVAHGVALVAAGLVLSVAWASGPEPPIGAVVHYGEMHEAIGLQRHHGRVAFEELLRREHFYAVAAVEGLAGEATILDGKAIVTMVDDRGRLRPMDAASKDRSATLLVGAYVPAWTKQDVDQTVSPDQFDAYIGTTASQAGTDVKNPFLFQVEGEFVDVRLHVINGACPIRARMKKEELPVSRKPFETELATVSGTILGVFAKDSVGKMTHPATSIHCHLVFEDPRSGEIVTGHVEQAGIQKGAQLRLPD